MAKELKKVIKKIETISKGINKNQKEFNRYSIKKQFSEGALNKKSQAKSNETGKTYCRGLNL